MKRNLIRLSLPTVKCLVTGLTRKAAAEVDRTAERTLAGEPLDGATRVDVL